MAIELVFYFVFIFQIFLLSIYYPKKIACRIRYVYETYPPSKYPKLYPAGNSEAASIMVMSGLKNFEHMNTFALIVGIGLIVAALLTGYSPYQMNVVPVVVVYAMLQFLPLMLQEASECNQMKLIRMTNKSSKRKTVLHQRGLLDFISPVFVIAAVFLIIANILFDLFNSGVNFSWGSAFYRKASAHTLVHIFFIGMIIWNLYIKKINPLQDHKDRMKQMEVAVKTAIFGSIAASVFFLIFSSVNALHIDYLEPLVMSIYMQMVGVFGCGTMLKLSRVEDTNFEVYKADAAAALS